MMSQNAGVILVVEDQHPDAVMLRILFEQMGLSNPCRFVPSAMDAIAYLKGSLPYNDRTTCPVPAVIMLDIRMPGMDGFEFLDWLKRHPEYDDILVVAISGLEDLASIRRAYALGADSFLTKPCRALDLENLMQWFPGYWLRPVMSY
jgi:CheY-like chemotaxis protein